jgi:hypothetical protein
MAGKLPAQCWQIAAGDNNRNYADLCLRHGSIMVGPGYAGPWGDPKSKVQLKSDGWSAKKIANIDLFCTSIQMNDLIVMRIGRSEVHGVGYVRSPYQYSELFADVDGWDLNHCYRVEWVWNKPEGKPAIFQDALQFGDTTQKLSRTAKTEELFKWMESLPAPKNAPLAELKLAGAKITEIEISRKLFHYGIGSRSLSSLEDGIRDLCSLAQWYMAYQVKPSERETVAHLVIPLLLALGWTPQRIALEFHQATVGRADVALYGNGDRKNYLPIAIIEAKKFEDACLTAEKQVRTYAENIPDVRRLVVTDGIRYGIFVCDIMSNKFPSEPNAYLNLVDLRDDYPVYGACKGADEGMLYLSADWNEKLKHPAVGKPGVEVRI